MLLRSAARSTAPRFGRLARLAPLVALVVGVACATSCTKDSAAVKEPVTGKPRRESATARPAAPPHNAAPTTPGAPIAGAPSPGSTASVPPANAADSCVALDKLSGEPPYYLAGRGVVITRFAKPCMTRDGRRGVEKDTPWLAMGFPCTGGSGRVDVSGHNYNAPKMVTFLLATDCGMSPASKEAVKKLAVEAFGLPEASRLVAYTPFVVQYWEIPGMEDADTGFGIELRSSAAVEGLWTKLRKNEPVRVRLYGRDNAWGQGDSFYFVEGDLKMAGRNAFQLVVSQVKILPRAEVDQVKSRCEAIRPKRNCQEVF